MAVMQLLLDALAGGSSPVAAADNRNVHFAGRLSWRMFRGINSASSQVGDAGAGYRKSSSSLTLAW